MNEDKARKADSAPVRPSAMEAWVLAHLSPRGFFAGIALGFVFCCVAGRVLPKLAPIRDVERLHLYLSPQTHYYPTALQVRAWARQQLPRDKIAVIIGGNSVLMGAGQPRNDLWTRRLQAELGDEYRICNVATPSGSPAEFGEVTTEIIARDHPRVIHLCNCNPAFFSAAPDGTEPQYRYLHYDARARGLLCASARRDAALTRLKADRPDIDALLLRAGVNRWLSFDDLWHVVGYEAAFTVWTSATVQHPWQARKRWPDTTVLPALGTALRDWHKAKPILLKFAAPYSADEWARFAAVTLEAVPPPLRSKTLAVIIRYNPASVARLDEEVPGFAARYDDKIRAALATLRSCGLQAIETGLPLEADDYVDSKHMGPSGGAKLARELAPAIRALSQRLGYLSGETP